MEERCQGQEERNLQLVEQACPNCGAEIEFFGGESTIKCHKCAQLVLRDS